MKSKLLRDIKTVKKIAGQKAIEGGITAISSVVAIAGMNLAGDQLPTYKKFRGIAGLGLGFAGKIFLNHNLAEAAANGFIAAGSIQAMQDLIPAEKKTEGFFKHLNMTSVQELPNDANKQKNDAKGVGADWDNLYAEAEKIAASANTAEVKTDMF